MGREWGASACAGVPARQHAPLRAACSLMVPTLDSGAATRTRTSRRDVDVRPVRACGSCMDAMVLVWCYQQQRAALTYAKGLVPRALVLAGASLGLNSRGRYLEQEGSLCADLALATLVGGQNVATMM